MYKDIEYGIPEKDNCFTAIRLFCSLIIIYEHCVVLAKLNYVNIDLSAFAVPIFFILSGFWVSISFLRSESISLYFIKRLKKIFPFYITVVLFSAILLSFVSKLSLEEYFKSKELYKYIFSNLLTLNFLQPSLPGTFEGIGNEAVNGSLWTIKIEICFYLLLPIIMYICSRFKKFGRNIFLSCLYIISILYEPIGTKLNIPTVLLHQMPAYLCYFICGILIVFNWDFFKKYIYYITTIAFLVFVLSVIFKIQFLIPITLGIIIFFIGIKVKFLSFIKKDYSYTIYLVHFPIIMCFLNYGFFENSIILSIIGIYGISFSVSYLLECTRNLFLSFRKQ